MLGSPHGNNVHMNQQLHQLQTLPYRTIKITLRRCSFQDLAEWHSVYAQLATPDLTDSNLV